MDAQDWIVTLRERDIWMGTEAGEMYLNAPAGTVTEETRNELSVLRTEFISLLEERHEVLCGLKLTMTPWDYLMGELFILKDRGEEGSEEFEHLCERVQRTNELIDALTERAKELENLFRYGERADPPRKWLLQKSIQQPHDEVDANGIRREVIVI